MTDYWVSRRCGERLYQLRLLHCLRTDPVSHSEQSTLEEVHVACKRNECRPQASGGKHSISGRRTL